MGRVARQNWYTLSKVFGEGLGYMYAATYGISVVCVRIGNFSGQRRDPEHPHHLGIPDCVQLFSECLSVFSRPQLQTWCAEMVEGWGRCWQPRR